MTTLFRGANLDDELWDELEELLISADVGVAPTQGLLDRLKTRVREEGTTRSEDALELLKGEMVAILTMGDQRGKTPFPSTGLKTGLTFPRDGGRDKNPLVLLMVGVNGVGKTTSIAKLTNLYQEQDKKVLLGAADTFRAAAIDQLQEWGRRLGADVIAHQPGADPGAVAFDALQAARARSADVVIIDTAGRLHTKANLMEEIKKVQRVLSKQDGGQTQQVLLALDATTGQNGPVTGQGVRRGAGLRRGLPGQAGRHGQGRRRRCHRRPAQAASVVYRHRGAARGHGRIRSSRLRRCPLRRRRVRLERV